MTNTVNSRAAIQARIAERQRQYRTSEYSQVDFLFGGAISRADEVKSASGLTRRY